MRNSLPRHPRRVFRAALLACAALFLRIRRHSGAQSAPIRSATTTPSNRAMQMRNPCAFLVSKRKIPLHSTASVPRLRPFPAPQSPFPALNLTSAQLLQTGQTLSGTPPVKASFAFSRSARPLRNFSVTVLPITAHSSSADLSFQPDGSRHPRNLSRPPPPPSKLARGLPRQPELGPRASASGAESFGSYREFRPSSRFSEFRLRSQSGLRNSSAHRRCLQQSSRSLATPAARIPSLPPPTANISTPSRAGTTLSIAQPNSRATNPFGPKFSANKLF